jgi:hypothetical protein
MRGETPGGGYIFIASSWDYSGIRLMCYELMLDVW